MSDVLDLKRPHRALDGGSGADGTTGPDFVEQDGVVFAWSESNCRYERAWWLYDTAVDCDLVHHLRATRAPAGWETPWPAGGQT